MKTGKETTGNPYTGFSKEELEYLLEHTEEIGSGCDLYCESCLGAEITRIEYALRDLKQFNL
jgi:hypothetical protein